MKKTQDEIIREVQTKHGPQAWIVEKVLNYENIQFFNRSKDLVARDRVGEVVFAVERENGKFICVRSSGYPEGIFRIPTGGISHGEDVLEAVHREVGEELGLKAEIKRFLGVIKIEMRHKDETVPFYSYLFHLKETGGRLLQDATDDEVSEIVEADADELARLSEKLLSIERGWRDWGTFRHMTTWEIAQYAKTL